MKKRKYIFTLLICLSMAFLAVGCATSEKSPQGAIRDAYGNKQYIITFSQDQLEEPLTEVYYTAYSIPKLPTPQKVGYVFAGWYFDAARTQPYEDEMLYLKMQNLTLYAKWEKEAMEMEGTYDIEYSAKILENSITAKTNYYRDFAKSIVDNETYIEYADGRIYLKLQYDSGVTVGFLSSPVFEVGVDVTSADKVKITDKISAETSTLKTIWLDITELDMSDPIYLSVTFNNYVDDEVNETNRKDYQVSYTVEFRITRFIGFSRPFVDTSKPLEDGTYLLKSKFTQGDDQDTMFDGYNPVYTYLFSEKGNYKLIKYFSPYTIFTDGVHTEESYYDRMTMYYSVFTCNNATDPDDNLSGTYKNVTYEFNADTDKYYYVLDIGNNLTDKILLYGISTGFMESGGGFAPSSKALKLDLDSVVKITSFDYSPLEGDAYKFSEDRRIYPKDAEEFAESHEVYDLVSKGGLSQAYFSYFFSSDDENIDLHSEGYKHYSSKITITPNKEAANNTLSDMSDFAHFTMTAYIYGYDEKQNDLCYDGVRSSLYSEYAMRDKGHIHLGKSCNKGDTVSLEDLYREKVDATADFGRVAHTAYEIADGTINFNKTVTVGDTFNFERNIAVLFTESGATERYTSLIEIVERETPTVKSEGNKNQKTIAVTSEESRIEQNSSFPIGTEVDLPQITASWYGVNYDFVGIWSENEGAEENVYPFSVAIFSGGANAEKKLTCRTAIDTPMKFTVDEAQVEVMYELCSKYGELYHVYFVYTGTGAKNWSIQDSEGNTVASGRVSINSSGKRTGVNENAGVVTLDKVEDITTQLKKGYKFVLDGEEETEEKSVKTVAQEAVDEDKMTITSCTIKSKSKVETLKNGELTAEKIKEKMNELLNVEKEKSAESKENDSYLSVEVVFTHKKDANSNKDDTYTVKYLYGLNFNGRSNPSVIEYDCYFTNTVYDFNLPDVRTVDGLRVGSVGTMTLAYFNNGAFAPIKDEIAKVTTLGKARQVVFLKEGTYRCTMSMSLAKFDDGKEVFQDGKTMTYSSIVEFNVKSDNTNVKIVYHTDAQHKFADSEDKSGDDDNTLIVEYPLQEKIILGGQGLFETTSDKLFKWSKYKNAKVTDTVGLYDVEKELTDGFVSTFNSDTIDLYAVWDKGISVTAHYEIEGKDGTKLCESMKRTFYITRTYFEVNLEQFTCDKVPSNYEQVGWIGSKNDTTGGEDKNMFQYGGKTEIGMEKSFSVSLSKLDASMLDRTIGFDIYAKFDRLLTIRYLIDESDKDKTDAYIVDDENFHAGKTLKISLDADSFARKQNVSAKDGYVFDGWQIKKANGTTKTIADGDEWEDFNIEETAITEEYADENGVVTLKAKFKSEDEQKELEAEGAEQAKIIASEVSELPRKNKESL